MPSDITGGISGIWGSSATSVFAVGNFNGGAPYVFGKICYFDGSSWTQESTCAWYSLHAIWGTSETDVFAVGGNDFDGVAFNNQGIILHYNGTSWDAMIQGTINLKAIWGSSGNDVFAVGGISNCGLNCPNNIGKILHYDGAAWDETSVDGVLYGVAGSTGNDVFAVGIAGAIFHYNGSSWSAMTSGTTQNLYAVWGSSGSDVFAVGEGGTILHHDGSAWTAMTSGSSIPLAGVWGSSSSDVFAVGYQTILHYDNPSETAPDKNPSDGGGNGCFIATTAYRNSMAEKVIFLQELRDKYLLTHPAGRGIPMAAGLLFVIMGEGAAIIRSRRGAEEL